MMNEILEIYCYVKTVLKDIKAASAMSLSAIVDEVGKRFTEMEGELLRDEVENSLYRLYFEYLIKRVVVNGEYRYYQ